MHKRLTLLLILISFSPNLFSQQEFNLSQPAPSVVTNLSTEESNHRALEISISPMPVKDRLNIASRTLILAYTLCNVLGQEILSFSELNSKTISSELSFLPTGKYVLRLKTKNGNSENM